MPAPHGQPRARGNAQRLDRGGSLWAPDDVHGEPRHAELLLAGRIELRQLGDGRHLAQKAQQRAVALPATRAVQSAEAARYADGTCFIRALLVRTARRLSKTQEAVMLERIVFGLSEIQTSLLASLALGFCAALLLGFL